MVEYLRSLTPELNTWLLFTSALFALGIYGMLSRRNAVGVLLSLELCLNAGAVNFALFNRFWTPQLVDGAVMSLFVIAVAAAEVVVAMAIFVALFGYRRTVDVTQLNLVRE